MKKYSMFLGAALSIFALVSCQKEIGNTEDNLLPGEIIGSVPFVLNASIAETKTTLNPSTWAVTWEDGNIIYAVTTDEEWGVAYDKDNPETDSIAEFVYDESTGKFETTSVISDGNHTFNFIYSNGNQKTYHRGASTTNSLSSSQIVDADNPTANLKAYDAMIAQKTVTTPASIADVTMDHLYTLMKVTIKNKTGAAVTVSSFEIEVPDEDIAGIFTVNFATPGISLKSGEKSKIIVTINNGTIANDGQKDIYFVMAPISSYSGSITFKATDNTDKTYSKTNTVSGLTFTAGSYNTASFTLKAGETIPTVDNTSSDYTTGFESTDGFTAGTTYNNTAIKEDGPDGAKWGSYYGTASTNSKLTGSQSMQMRWYTSAISNLGYAETNFFIKKVGYVSFSAAATNSLKVGLYYKGEADSDWSLAETFTPTGSKASYSYTFTSPIDNARIRFGIILPSSNPTATSNVRIDDVVVKAIAPAAPAVYSISISDSIEHGSVSSNKSEAEEGEEVTLTITPDPGYQLESLIVDGNNVTSSVVNKKCSFNMPSNDVDVSASFSLIPTYSITIDDSIENGEINATKITGIVEGESITLSITPDSGYALETLYVDGIDVTSWVSTGQYIFDMPGNDVTVTASFIVSLSKTEQTLFHESFGNNTGSARVWSDSYSVKSGVASVYSGASYTITNAKQSKSTMGHAQSALVAGQGAVGTFIVGPLAVSDCEDMVVTYYYGMSSGTWNAGSYVKCYYSTDGASYSEVSNTSESTPSGAVSNNKNFVLAQYDLPSQAISSTLYLKFEFYCYQINKSNAAIGQAYFDEIDLTGKK